MNGKKESSTPISVSVVGDSESGVTAKGKKSRGVLWTVVVLLTILLAVLLIYKIALKGKLSQVGQSAKNPYPAGTTIHNPTSLPAEFPQDALREKYKLDKVSTVVYPDGSTVITVAYTSENQVFGLLSTYTQYFKQSPWTLLSSQLSQESGVVVAKNEVGQMTVTIAPAKEGQGSRVTFSYQYIIK